MADPVERFSYGGDWRFPLVPDPEGNLIRYSDYKRLEAERDQARKQVLEEVREGLETKAQMCRERGRRMRANMDDEGEHHLYFAEANALELAADRILAPLRPDQSKGEGL